MTSYEQLFRNNAEWVKARQGEDPLYFERMSGNQQPDYLYIGCSDSRVPANEIIGLEAGELFVHRNIANMVISIDLNAVSVINYAVKQLDVKHIIVCGHYGCGGVQAAMMPKDMGILNPCLRNIRDVSRLHQPELDGISDMNERYNRLVELNVQEQCVNVIKMAVVQETYESKGYPEVHGWVFDMHNGSLKDLEIDFVNILKNIQQIYDLTGNNRLI